MQAKKISNGTIYFFTDHKGESPLEFVQSIRNRPIIGKYLKTEWEAQDLAKKISHDPHHANLNLDQQKIAQLIDKSLNKCATAIPTDRMEIFVFPTYDPFVKTNMNGANGHCYHANSLFFFINPVEGFETALKCLVAHEFNHSAAFSNHKWTRIIDSLVFEGLAECFREEVMGGPPAKWATQFTQKQCEKWYESKIKNLIQNRLWTSKRRLHHEIFFGSKEFPPWLGYSLGYRIAKAFRKQHARLSWPQIMRLKPIQILRASPFGASKRMVKMPLRPNKIKRRTVKWQKL